MMTIQAINPATSEVLKTYEEMAPATSRISSARLTKPFSVGGALPLVTVQVQCEKQRKSCAPMPANTRI